MVGITSKKLLSGINTLSLRGIHMTASINKISSNGPLDLATSLEKQEWQNLAVGNDDPFRMKIIKRLEESSTPTLIPSYFQKRIIGCICREDSSTVKWMWLTQGEVNRCECGYHFKLIPRENKV